MIFKIPRLASEQALFSPPQISSSLQNLSNWLGLINWSRNYNIGLCLPQEAGMHYVNNETTGEHLTPKQDWNKTEELAGIRCALTHDNDQLTINRLGYDVRSHLTRNVFYENHWLF